MAEEMRAMSREGRAARLVEPEEMVPPLLYVVSREADRVNGMRFDANAWDAALAPAEAARLAGRPAGFVLQPQAPPPGRLGPRAEPLHLWSRLALRDQFSI